MERLFRGVIQVGGVPLTDECRLNWYKLADAELEFPSFEDSKIFEYLTKFYGQMSAPPDIALVREYFEKLDEIEVSTRLDEIKAAQVYIRTNYESILRGVMTQHAIKSVTRIASQVQQIAANGCKLEKPINGKTTVRGVEDAIAYATEKFARVRAPGEGAFRLETPTEVAGLRSRVNFAIKHFQVASGRPNIISAYAGQAKTFLACELALAVAAGRKTCWGGVAVSCSGPVVHLDYEMGRNKLYRRYQRMAFGMGIDMRALRPRDKPNGTFASVMSILEPSLSNEDLLGISCFPGVNLASHGARSAFKKLCTGKSLLIIDSFKAATAGSRIEENSSEIRIYLDMLTQVSDETGCVVVVLHHERKSSKDTDSAPRMQSMRGSSAIADALGSTVHIDKIEAGMRLSQGKVSDGRAGEPVVFALEDVATVIGEGDDTYPEGIRIIRAQVEESHVRESEQMEQLLSVLRAGPAANKEELARAAKLKDAVSNRLVDRLVDSGAIVASGKGGRGPYKLATVAISDFFDN